MYALVKLQFYIISIASCEYLCLFQRSAQAPAPYSSQNELGLIGPIDVRALLLPLQLSIVATFNGIIVTAQLNLNMSWQ